MSLFRFQDDRVLTSFEIERHRHAPTQSKRGTGAKGTGRGEGLAMAPAGPTEADLSDQFVVFSLSQKAEGESLLEASAVEPGIVGSAESPDVLVALEMLSFQLGAKESVAPNTRATMRINFGKDESSTDKRFDTVFWSIAAGLSLYDQAKGGRADGKELKGDFQKAFGHRPIEIPGGLGRLSFEVVKHTEPPWWKSLFGFLGSDTGKRLVSVLGFPAITSQAIDLIDELLDKLTRSSPEVLFRSIPMRLALSQYARDAFTGGSQRVKLGALRQGFCVMARGRDFDILNDSKLIYYPTYGKLVPESVSPAQLATGQYDDPVREVTYAVFRVGTKETRLDPTFNFGS